MASKSKYEIIGTQPTVYLDKSGQAVNGYLVNVNLVEYDEVHSVRVPSLDAPQVKAVIDKLLAQRQALAELGS